MIVFEEKRGRHTLQAETEGEGYRGLASLPDRMGQYLYDDDFERLKRRLRLESDLGNPRYFGVSGATERFLSVFPKGFTDDEYVDRERSYKVAASATLATVLPVSKARTATADQAASIARVFDTGSLHEAELAIVTAMLKGPTGTEFVRGAVAFLDGRYSEGLKAMDTAARPYGKATWAIVTYLPWLWDPGRHIFLKPMAMKDFASRIGHDLARDYEAALFPDVYRSALDLAEQIFKDLAHLGIRDMIDVQGFVWVVGSYEDVGR